MPGIVVRPRSRIFHGHDWVYATEVLKAWGNPQDGEAIVLKDGKDRMLGSAIYNSKSQIIARRFSRQRQELDMAFFQRRIEQAIKYRERRGVCKELCRLVWSESDGLPGLIVDRYGDFLVMQTLTLAMDRHRQMIAETLVELLRPAGIVERNDAPVRAVEGLELRTGMLYGGAPESFLIEVSSLQFGVDLVNGQKTGFYLDQIGNYEEVARFAEGKRVLDCFSNQGAFALACAKHGAKRVTAVEISESACVQIEENAKRNSLAVEVLCRNVFDFLKLAETAAASGNEDARYDLIILDPPSFTRSKGRLQDAMRGYKEIHLRALKLLTQDGMLATFCCSHHVSREAFLETITGASVDAKRTLRQIGVYSQNVDHPIVPTLPETEYLKGFLFELAPGR